MKYKELKDKLKKLCIERKLTGYSKYTTKVDMIKVIKNPTKYLKAKRIKKKKKSTKTSSNIDYSVIYKPDIIKIFNERYSRSSNDKMNKLRELFIKEVINNEKKFDNIFKNSKYNKKYINFKINLKKILSQFIDKKYDKIRIEIKGGRNHNNDFKVNYYKNGKIIDTKKVEFKYGVTRITQYPEIYSKYAKTASIFKNKDYIEYFYNNIDNFIQKFPDDIQKQLIKYKPKTLTDYKKIINDTTYKHKFQNIIYTYNKSKNDKKNLPHKRYVIEGIKEFINNITINDINFDKWKEEIQTKQYGKIFLMCKNNNFTHITLDKEITIKKEMSRRNGNTLVFETEDNKFQIYCLLRWKNHQGVSGPGWQVKLHFVKSRA